MVLLVVLVFPNPNSNPNHNPITIIIEKKSSETSTLSSIFVHDPRLMSEAELQYWTYQNDAWEDATTAYLRSGGMAAIDLGEPLIFVFAFFVVHYLCVFALD